jgi:hypothetical protein
MYNWHCLISHEQEMLPQQEVLQHGLHNGQVLRRVVEQGLRHFAAPRRLLPPRRRLTNRHRVAGDGALKGTARPDWIRYQPESGIIG